MSFSDYDWYILGVIAALTVCSVLTRSSYFLLGDYIQLGAGVRRALRYAPTAALIGIIIPELLPWQPDVGVVLDAKALAALAAIVLYWRTGSTLLVIVGGMVAFWGIRFLFQL